jgi:hypothetical protein
MKKPTLEEEEEKPEESILTCPQCQTLIPMQMIRAEAARIMNEKRPPFKNWMTHEQAVENGRKGALVRLNRMRRGGRVTRSKA